MSTVINQVSIGFLSYNKLRDCSDVINIVSHAAKLLNNFNFGVQRSNIKLLNSQPIFRSVFFVINSLLHVKANNLAIFCLEV